MGRFTAQNTAIDGLVVLDRQILADNRGSLSRLFCREELAEFGWHGPIAQINETRTHAAGTIRGLHFQHPPHRERKLITCLEGAIHDVVVDIRKGSPTFMQHVSVELSKDNARQLLVPPGCAHGFQSLTDTVAMIYCHSCAYHREVEDGLRFDDPRLAIQWPRQVTAMSDRDRMFSLLTEDYSGIGP